MHLITAGAESMRTGQNIRCRRLSHLELNEAERFHHASRYFEPCYPYAVHFQHIDSIKEETHIAFVGVLQEI